MDNNQWYVKCVPYPEPHSNCRRYYVMELCQPGDMLDSVVVAEIDGDIETARLIAAVPDMVDVLREIANNIECTESNVPFHVMVMDVLEKAGVKL